MLTQEQTADLERAQKIAVKLILKNSKNCHKNYEDSLNLLQMDTLKNRREALCLVFTKKCLKHEKMKFLFPKNEKKHNMKTRNPEKFKIDYANTERLKNSPVLFMQRLLNVEETRKK